VAPPILQHLRLWTATLALHSRLAYLTGILPVVQDFYLPQGHFAFGLKRDQHTCLLRDKAGVFFTLTG